MKKFYGTGVAIITPFNTDGTVDHTALKKLINYLIDGGVQYLVSLGTTGETSTLSNDEKKAVWDITAETIDKRVPLVAGIGGNNTSEISSSLKSFNTDGFDAILSVSPYYSKPTQEGLYQHYKAVSDASSLPVILYNVPSRTGCNISVETILRLAHDVKNIIGVKEASADFDQFNRIVKDKPDDFLFISGDDSITLPMVALGAAGVISVAGNAFPKLVSTMVRLCLDGQFKEALPLHNSLVNITRLMFVDGSPAGVKAILKLLDLCGDTLRLPLVNVSSNTFDAINYELPKLR
ncbi:MAG TPA: 4-hydroxy-tetrahydrodipicolinate synthase [Sphingobacteriaceae bacterium]|nr:4-hydroxy-tetrahydrodipicolinate synthase [Sphingobacteriaceae bacterium]